MTTPQKPADVDTVCRRIAAANARLDDEIAHWLERRHLDRERLTTLGQLGAALPSKVVARFGPELEQALAALPPATELSLEQLRRPEHAGVAARGLALIRA